MTPGSPGGATLWEIWRVTRAEAAWKLVLPITLGLAALGLGAAFAPADNPAQYRDVNDLLAALALTLIVVPHIAGWQSLARLNGAEPGFPLYLSYTRPVRTAVMVLLPMAYLTAMSTTIYVASASILRVTSGYAFPLLPVAAWVAALTVVGLAAGWSTRNRALQLVVFMSAVVKALSLAMERLTAVEIPNTFDWPPRMWPTLFDWPRSDYAWIALIGLASAVITVVMVGRQRRGDALVTITWSTGGRSHAESRDSVWGWLVGLFRLPCPTASATRAQLWYDLRSNGLPLLSIGVTLALVIALVAAVSGPIDAAINADPRVSCPIGECFYVRAMPVMFAPFALFIMASLGVNAFGIRRKQGWASISAFEATQTSGTAQVALLKLLVKSACVLAAIIAIAVGAWVSMPWLGDAVFVQMLGVPLSSRRSAITGVLASLATYELLALVVVAIAGVVGWVASWAALGALWTRYPRRLRNAFILILLYGIVLVLLALAGQRWGALPVSAILTATSWAVAAAALVTTAYLSWRMFAERLLTVRQAAIVVVVSIAFAAAWLTLLRAAGLTVADMSATDAARILSPALLPLTLSVLVPWSYSRVRHS